MRTSKNVKQFANGVAPKHLRQHFRQLYEEATSAPTDRQASSSSEGSTESVDSKRKFAVRTIQPRSEQVSGSVPPSSQPPTANHQQQTTGRRGREATRDLFDRRLSDMMPVVHLRLGDTAQVKLQLEHRLRNLHQIPVKKIAKAWIKAICPKKQARFPYQNCAYEKVTGQSPPRPEWWPPVSVCAYKEPDHIHRDRKSSIINHSCMPADPQQNAYPSVSTSCVCGRLPSSSRNGTRTSRALSPILPTLSLGGQLSSRSTLSLKSWRTYGGAPRSTLHGVLRSWRRCTRLLRGRSRLLVRILAMVCSQRGLTSSRTGHFANAHRNRLEPCLRRRGRCREEP